MLVLLFSQTKKLIIEFTLFITCKISFVFLKNMYYVTNSIHIGYPTTQIRKSRFDSKSAKGKNVITRIDKKNPKKPCCFNAVDNCIYTTLLELRYIQCTYVIYNVIYTTWLQGRIQDFKLGGAHFKNIATSGGRRENFWGISCEKSRFYASKLYFFQFQRAPPGSAPDCIEHLFDIIISSVPRLLPLPGRE